MLLIISGFGLASDAYAQKPKVLILYAEQTPWGDDVVAKVSNSGFFSGVDGFDCRSAVPSLSYLQNYKGVLVFTDYGAAAGVANVLGDYIDAGGGVVGCMFTQAGAPMSGKYWTSTYQVFTPSGYTAGSVGTLGTVTLPNHPIMNGVSSYNGGSSSYRSIGTTLVADAYRIASYTDGNILAAAREKVGPKLARRADLNFFPVSSAMRSDFWQVGTDGHKLLANALLWVAGGGETPTQFSLSPESMNFGSQYPGIPTVLCGQIRNVGLGTLRITTTSLSGSTDFAIVNAPAANDTVAAGQSVAFCIRFNASNTGSRNATFTVVTNGVDSGTQTVNLSGIGAAPSMSLSEDAIFRKTAVRLRDSATACIPLTSSGIGAVRIDSVVIRGNDSTAYYVASRPLLIDQGTTQSVCVRFKPNFEGRSDAQVWIYSNAFNKPLAKIQMVGIGTLGRFVMSPGILDFDSVMLGETACQVVMIKNPGTDTMRITRNYVASRDADYVLTPISGRDTMIRPNDSVAFNVCFTPVKNGTRLARYIFDTDIPMTFEAVSRDTSQFVLDIRGVGVPVGRLAMTNPAFPGTVIGDEICRVDTLRNGGATPVTITSASVAGLNSSDFTIDGLTIPATLAPGEIRLITICFTATDRGDREAMILFGTTSEGKSGEAQFDLAGTGLLNCAQADPTSIFDGTMTYVGTPESKIITVTNCGEVDRAYTITLPTGTTAYRVIGASTSGMIAPNGTTTFEVEFKPTAMGLADATAEITGGPTPINVLLNGTGGAVMLGASGNGGTVAQGDCKTFDVTVTNNGNVDWVPGTGVIGGVNSSDFTIERAPSLIAAGESGIVTIKFCPSTKTNETATLNFPSATPSEITTTFPYALSGSGVQSSVAITESNGYRLGQSYPNPMSAMSSFTFTQPHAGNVKIELIDRSGTVIPVTSGYFPMGESTIQIDASGLASGTYLYVLSNDEIRLSRQLTIVK